MKSALEIAMEKTAGGQEGGALTDEQKSAIGELEKEYQAKIAEQGKSRRGRKRTDASTHYAAHRERRQRVNHRVVDGRRLAGIRNLESQEYHL